MTALSRKYPIVESGYLPSPEGEPVLSEAKEWRAAGAFCRPARSG
jgi:hypothetical protein